MSEEITQQDQALQETLQEAEPTPEEHVGEETVPAHAQPEEPSQPRPNEENIRALREKAKRLEEERNQYFEYIQKQQQAQQQQPKEPEPQLGPDDLVEWKHVQKEIAGLKNEIKQYQQHQAQASAETRLKMQYPDFDKIVSPDNIASLREQYPELAATVNSNQDLYTKASAAYTLIKKLGIAPDEQYARQRAQAEQNMQKPRPVNSINPQRGNKALDQANAFAQGLTDDLKKSLWQEIKQSRKGA